MKWRVLFVDDEPAILELYQILFASEATIEVAVAERAEAALRMLEQRRFDAVVSDMVMPGMNGATLLNEVMRRFPAVARRSQFVERGELSVRIQSVKFRRAHIPFPGRRQG